MRTREFTGPTPHSVALMFRSNSNKPREYVIQERQRTALQNQRQDAMNQKMTQLTFDLKNEWEKKTDNAIRRRNIQNRVNAKLFEHELALEERKNRLSEILTEEESNFESELQDHLNGETKAEKLARMRARAKELAEKREAERLKIVEEKEEQRWRGECEELREVMSRRHQDEVCTARKHQIQIKAQLHKDHLEEEKLYTRLWREDELVKLHREETEAMQHHQANQQNVAILNKQVAFKLEKEREAEREKELEFQELEEERKQRRAEDEAKYIDMLQKRETFKDELLHHRDLRQKRDARKKKEEIKLDAKIVKEASKALDDENHFAAELRDQRISYEKEYREYLRQLRQDEAEREAEIDRLYIEDQRREWEMKSAKQRDQNAARSKLLSEVMQIREQQLNHKAAIRKEEIEAKREERGRVMSDVETFKKEEIERKARISEQNRYFKSYQMEQAQRLREVKQAEAEQVEKDHAEELERIAANHERVRRAVEKL